MPKKKLHIESIFALSALIPLFWVAAPVNAQTAPAKDPTSAQAQDSDGQARPDYDATRPEIVQFEQFLDGHKEIGEQVRKDPSLVNREQFVKDHPELQTYLREHPEVREELRKDPNAFMHQGNRLDASGYRRDNDATRAQLAQFDQFLDSHREIAEQIRKNPSIADNQAFVENHPALMTFLQQHPEIRQDLKSNPSAFMQQEDRFDRRDDGRARDNDRNRQEVARFDQFLDGHREIAEQVRKNPALLNDDRFAKDHPVLQAYLQDHPGIRDEARDNPNAFMHQEDQFDRNERNGYGGNPEMSHDRSADFRQFLNGHSDVAQQLSHNPALANDKDYMRSHPELQSYLKTHPDVNQELTSNPDGFMKSAQPSPQAQQPQQFDKTDQGAKVPSYDPKTTH